MVPTRHRLPVEENKENGISIEDAMRREKDADGNITEGNLQLPDPEFQRQRQCFCPDH